MTFKRSGRVSAFGAAAFEDRLVALDQRGETARLALGEAALLDQFNHFGNATSGICEVGFSFVFGRYRLRQFQSRQLVIEFKQNVTNIDALAGIYLEAYQSSLNVRG